MVKIITQGLLRIAFALYFSDLESKKKFSTLGCTLNLKMWFLKIAILGYATHSVSLFQHQGMVSLTKTNVYSEFGHPTERLVAFTMKKWKKLGFLMIFGNCVISTNFHVEAFRNVHNGYFAGLCLWKCTISQTINIVLVGCTIKNIQEIT